MRRLELADKDGDKNLPVAEHESASTPATVSFDSRQTEELGSKPPELGELEDLQQAKENLATRAGELGAGLSPDDEAKGKRLPLRLASDSEWVWDFSDNADRAATDLSGRGRSKDFLADREDESVTRNASPVATGTNKPATANETDYFEGERSEERRVGKD